MLGWTPADHFGLRGSIAAVNSNDERTDAPLFGSPPLTTELEAKYHVGDAWTFAARHTHRFAMDDPGFEEVARDSVDLVDLELDYRIAPELDLGLYLKNAFDENYFATADALSALAPERSFGIHLTWQAQ